MVLISAFERLLEQKAVALQYSPEKDTAPVIVASGMGYMAEKITEAARKSGVPVYEDDSLATLLSRLQLGAAVPEELYQAIIEIYIYFLGYVPSPEEKENEKNEKNDTVSSCRRDAAFCLRRGRERKRNNGR